MRAGDGFHRPRENCWRVSRADRLSVIIDGDNYFRAVRQAMLRARKRIFLIGWDFDTRIKLDRSPEPDEGPVELGPFLSWMVDQNPELEVFILRWDFGALKALFRGGAIGTLVRWIRSGRIHMKLDGHHPFGASHHQKIVVIDDGVAFCGGIDMLCDRWDTREHADDEGRREMPGHSPCGPWHDATTALQGPAAADLGELARERWARVSGQTLAPVEGGADCWPERLEPQFRDVDVAISRTFAPHKEQGAVYEIEQLYLDQIRAAKRYIYAESQYFASRRIAEALAARLREPNGPEIVLVNPWSAHGWLEPVAMDTARARLHEAVRQSPHGDRFRIYLPYTAAGQPIYVHAKIFIADEEILRIGSSNWNNRSMRLDTECDIALRAGPDDAAMRAEITALRDGLIGEHLGVPPETAAREIAERGSIIETIEALRGEGRTLRPYETDDLNGVQRWLADNEVLDPEGPDEMFEPIEHRGLFRLRWMRP